MMTALTKGKRLPPKPFQIIVVHYPLPICRRQVAVIFNVNFVHIVLLFIHPLPPPYLRNEYLSFLRQMLGFSVMIKSDAHTDKEKKMGDQNGQNQRRRFLGRLVTGQQRRRSIPQNQQSTGSAGGHQDNPGNEIDGDNAQDGGWQKGDHAVTVIAHPFGPRQGREGHATRRQPKDGGNAKDKGRHKGPGVEQMVNVVFEFFHFAFVTKGCRPVGCGL